MRIIVKNMTPKEPEGERESLRKVTTGTLKWTPMGWEVEGDVDLSEKGLEMIPYRFHRVGGNFDAYKNLLTSLEGSPRIVGGGFYAYDNNLTSLIGGPEEVGKDFSVSGNFLISLVGSPKIVRGGFYATGNKLISIKGITRRIGIDLSLANNKNLTSLEDFPEEVRGRVYLCGISVPPVESIPGVRGKIIWG